MHSFWSATPTPRGCTQLPLARYRLHSVLKNWRGNERQLYCLRLSRSSRQVDCARKSPLLTNLYIPIESLVSFRPILHRAVSMPAVLDLLLWMGYQARLGEGVSSAGRACDWYTSGIPKFNLRFQDSEELKIVIHRASTGHKMVYFGILKIV